jgi:hypothetical protein
MGTDAEMMQLLGLSARIHASRSVGFCRFCDLFPVFFQGVRVRIKPDAVET